jgi:hypothetical protein
VSKLVFVISMYSGHYRCKLKYNRSALYRLFQKELCNFESVYTFIQRTCTAPCIARNLPVGLQFTRDTRILLRTNVLYVMPSHPVAHMPLTLRWNSLGTASFKVHESQRNVRLGKLLVALNHNYQR